MKEEEDILVNGKYYQGNENILRNKNATFKWTEERIADFKLCVKSILHFAENHFYITSLDRGKERIQLYKYQKRLLKSFKSNRFNVVLSSRQSGKTTTITIYALWLACFKSDKRITIVANKESTAKEIYTRIKMAYEQLPIYLKPAVKSWRKDGFSLTNDSEIKISTTSAAGPRGSSSNLLIIDEMAHCPSEVMKELWKSAIPIITASSTSQIVVISTPNGEDNKFYELCEDAKKENSEWNLETVDWSDVPGRDEAWKKTTLGLLGNNQDDFDQEYCNVFLKKGRTVIDNSILEELKSQSIDPIMVLDEGKYHIFQMPSLKQLYVVGVDVGEGIGRTNSVAQILNITNLQGIELVASYVCNDVNPFLFGSKLLNILIDWGRPPVLVENNNYGQQVLDVLVRTHNYENIVTYNSAGMNKSYKIEDRFGIHNTTNTRYNGITNFRYWGNTLKALKIKDLNTLLEINNFVRLPNYTYTKRTDTDLDDRVFALIWALFILDPNLVHKHFIVEETDNQGRAVKLLPLFDNSEYLKSSRLMKGDYNYNYIKTKKETNFVPSFLPQQNQFSNLQMERIQMEYWLQGLYQNSTDPINKEENESLDSFSPIIMF
jgi:hypothetical protein